MTGFGTAKAANERITVTVEIKSLNSKSLDASFRLPRNFSDKELEVRNMLNQALERGKVSVNVDIWSIGEIKPKTVINRPLVKAYYQDLSSLAIELGASQTDIFRLALQMPEAYINESDAEVLSLDWDLIKQTLIEALKACNNFRIKEGEELATNLSGYIFKIGALLQKIVEQDPQRIQKIKTRIQNHITDILSDDNFDKSRFEQEMIYYIEKLDISEEKVRLQVHLDHFMEVLKTDDTPGKKLNFISQEIGREINTIGSKANDAVIQRYVIEMKEELEKIKEQTLNIL